jgi:hypothetical protein
MTDKDFSYKLFLLEELNSYRKYSPKSLCDIAEMQIILFYEKNDEKSVLMNKTTTMELLWRNCMMESSAIKGYST